MLYALSRGSKKRVLYCFQLEFITEICVTMSTINKASVRDELDRIQSEFTTLSKDGKVSAECSVLFKSILILVELVISIFMEKATKKNSSNSGIPPSQTDEDQTTPKKNRSKEETQDSSDTKASNTRTVETITTATVETCSNCHACLQDVACQSVQRRTRIDIIFEKTVEHTDAQVKKCPACNHKTTGAYPEDMHGPLQYGNGLKAYIIHLLVSQMIPLNRVQKQLATLIDVVISQTTMLCYIMKLYYALEQWEADSIKLILATEFIHVDETSMRVNKKKCWIHVYSSGDIVLKFIHKKRGKKAIRSIGIIPRFKGVLIHDCWSSYLSYEHLLHALCGAHLLRELKFIVQSNGYAFARNMKKLLKKTCKKVALSDDKAVSDKEYQRLQKHYRNLITRGEKELPEIPKKPKGKRGKVAKSDAHNLLERMKKYEAAVLLFAKYSHVAFTNNRAERDLRMDKVKQKVSGCFRTFKYAKAYCRIVSYIKTMQNKNISPMVAIQMALTGQIYKK